MSTEALRVRVTGPGAPDQLLSVLTHVVAVRFVGRPDPAEANLDLGSISPAGSPDVIATALASPPSVLLNEAPMTRVHVRFAEHALVPWPFRGREVACDIPEGFRPLVPADGEIVLAETHEGPMWTATVLAGGHVRFRSALPLLELSPDGSLAQAFSGANFLSNLPLVQLLAHCGARGLQSHQGSLRAAFMFDDPNLHWPTYGYVRYEELVALAEKENFHTSFATIPLDAWFTHARTAAMFRDHADRLSLLVHGNDHTRHELAQQLSPTARLALLSQALKRIERLERRSGLTVDRIMVPPHGACSEDMISSFPGAGFEGACISSGSLQAHNPRSTWVKTLGFRPAESILGCPVLPRWSFAASAGDVLLAAYLGRPIILRGHHGDLKEGVEILTQHARLINSLGDVRWSNVADLLWSSYHLTLVGTTAHVVPYARRVALHLPKGTDRVVITPAVVGDGVEVQRYVVRSSDLKEALLSAGQAATVQGHGVLTITLDEGLPDKPLATPLRLRAKPVLRRALTEVRDRLMPLTAV